MRWELILGIDQVQGESSCPRRARRNTPLTSFDSRLRGHWISRRRRKRVTSCVRGKERPSIKSARSNGLHRRKSSSLQETTRRRHIHRHHPQKSKWKNPSKRTKRESTKRVQS